MNELTVWVNHPSLENSNPFEIADAVIKAAKEAHKKSNPALTIISATSEGPKAIRRLFTDHHVSARYKHNEKTHHLQIQAYRSERNTIFPLSNCKIFSEQPNNVAAAVATTYDAKGFSICQRICAIQLFFRSTQEGPGQTD